MSARHCRTESFSGTLPAPWPCTLVSDRPLAVAEDDAAPPQALTRLGRYLGRDLWRLDWLGTASRVVELPPLPATCAAVSAWEQPALLADLVNVEVLAGQHGPLKVGPQAILADAHDPVAQRWILRRELFLPFGSSPLARFTAWAKLYRGRKLLLLSSALDWLDWPAGLKIARVTVRFRAPGTYRMSILDQQRKAIIHRSLGLDWQGETSVELWDQRSEKGPDCRNLRDWSAMQGLYNGGGPLAGLYTAGQQAYYRAHPDQFAPEFPTMVDTQNWPSLAGCALSLAVQFAGRDGDDPSGYGNVLPETIDHLAHHPPRFVPERPASALAQSLRQKFRAETWEVVDQEPAPHLCPTRIVDQSHGGQAGQQVTGGVVLYRNGSTLAHYFPSQLVEWAEWSGDPDAERFARLAIEDLLNLFYDHRGGRLRRGNYFGQSGSNWWFLPDPSALLLAGWFFDDRRAAAAYLAHTAGSLTLGALARLDVEQARRARCQSLVSAMIGWDAGIHSPETNEALAAVAARAAAVLLSLDSDPRHDGASPLWDGRLPLLATAKGSPRTYQWLLEADRHPLRHLAGHGACHLLGLDVLLAEGGEAAAASPLLRSVPALREWAEFRTGNHFSVWMAQVFGLFPHLARAAERAGIDLDSRPQPAEAGNYPCVVGKNNWVEVLVAAGCAVLVRVDWQLRGAGGGVYCGYLDGGQDHYVTPPISPAPARGAVWNPANLPRAVRDTGRDVYRMEWTIPATSAVRIVRVYLYTNSAACLPMAPLTDCAEALHLPAIEPGKEPQSMGSALRDDRGRPLTIRPSAEPVRCVAFAEPVWLSADVEHARNVRQAVEGGDCGRLFR